jgi:hypothetical protein
MNKQVLFRTSWVGFVSLMGRYEIFGLDGDVHMTDKQKAYKHR